MNANNEFPIRAADASGKDSTRNLGRDPAGNDEPSNEINDDPARTRPPGAKSTSAATAAGLTKDGIRFGGSGTAAGTQTPTPPNFSDPTGATWLSAKRDTPTNAKATVATANNAAKTFFRRKTNLHRSRPEQRYRHHPEDEWAAT